MRKHAQLIIYAISFLIGTGVGATCQERADFNRFRAVMEDSMAEMQALTLKLQHSIDEIRWNIDGSLLYGTASWYGPGFHGKITASGQEYDMFAMTAAHTRLPFGCEVRIENLVNRKVAIATINDRGPFVYGRMLDVSLAVAKQLGMVDMGLVPVKVRVIPGGMVSPRPSREE